MTDVFTPEQTAAIEAIVTRVLTPPKLEPVVTCPICGLGPVDRPDDKGRHQNCGEHDDGRPISRPCTRCGNSTSVRHDADPADAVCSWCKRGDSLREAEKQRAQLPPPPRPGERPEGPAAA